MYLYGTGPSHESLDIPVIRDRVPLGVFHPRRQNVQETRGSVARHAGIGGSNGPEDVSYGARRRHHYDGSRLSTSAADTVQGRKCAGAANALQGRQCTGTTNALLIAAQFPQTFI